MDDDASLGQWSSGGEDDDGTDGTDSARGGRGRKESVVVSQEGFGGMVDDEGTSLGVPDDENRVSLLKRMRNESYSCVRWDPHCFTEQNYNSK